jgi:hypothetical protein
MEGGMEWRREEERRGSEVEVDEMRGRPLALRVVESESQQVASCSFHTNYYN